VTETSTNCRLGIVIAGPPARFGLLNARILRHPRPVINDYACPFGFTRDRIRTDSSGRRCNVCV